MSSISNLTTTDAPHWDRGENHGPLVSVLTWFFIITAFFAVLARVMTRLYVVRKMRWDDGTIIVAMLLSIAHSVTTSLQANNGLGRHIGKVSEQNLIKFQKTTYASGFLYITIIAMVKISICLYLNALTPVRMHRTIILALGGFTALWMASSLLVLGFQCHLPSTWQIIGGKCIDVIAFWTYFHVVDILTDIALVVLPWLILSKLQVDSRKKATIIGCFTCRIFVVVFTILQAHYLQSRTAHTSDLTYDLWSVSLLAEVVLTLSIVTACVPYLKPFMESLESGVLRTVAGGPLGSGERSTSRSRNYGPSSKISNKGSRSQLSAMRMDRLGFAGEKGGNFERQIATISAKGNGGDSDDDSQTSQSKIIRKTVGWSVTEEPSQLTPPAHTHAGFPPRNNYAHAV